jgi:hypothetical protein
MIMTRDICVYVYVHIHLFEVDMVDLTGTNAIYFDVGIKLTTPAPRACLTVETMSMQERKRSIPTRSHALWLAQVFVF